MSFVLYFFAAVVLIYMPCLYLWSFLKNKKAGNYAVKNNAVKVYIQRTKISDLLTIYSVNEKAPVLHSGFTRYGFYALPGKNILHVQYQYQPFLANLFRKVLGLTHVSGIAQVNIKDKKLVVHVEKGREYLLYYDHDRGDYVFAENNENIP